MVTNSRLATRRKSLRGECILSLLPRNGCSHSHPLGGGEFSWSVSRFGELSVSLPLLLPRLSSCSRLVSPLSRLHLGHGWSPPAPRLMQGVKWVRGVTFRAGICRDWGHADGVSPAAHVPISHSLCPAARPAAMWSRAPSAKAHCQPPPALVEWVVAISRHF